MTRENFHQTKFLGYVHNLLNKIINGLETQNIAVVRHIYSNLPLLLQNRMYSFHLFINSKTLHTISSGYSDLINHNFRCARLEAKRLNLLINRLN